MEKQSVLTQTSQSQDLILDATMSKPKKSLKRKTSGMHDAIAEGIPTLGKILLALLFVAVLLVIWNVVSGGMSKGQSKIATMNTQMDVAQVTQYNGQSISGATLVAYIQTVIPVNEAKSKQMGLSKCTFSVDAPSISGANQGAFTGYGDPSNEKYINPSDSYTCTVTMDTSGNVPTKVEFKKAAY